ncbi:MAG: glycosyltransferase family 4 protein [Gemmataceae bacterium]|nr:glycosyltransferase family 4 protein [Gemmataceae bacterium]
MDRANLELARFLANDCPVHLVAHRCDPSLTALPNITVHYVPRPFGKHLLGRPLLAWTGRYQARPLSHQGFRIIVNGGNCPWPDVNWVHYLHAGSSPTTFSSSRSRMFNRLHHRLALRDEQLAFRKARLFVCNSQWIARKLIEHYNLTHEQVHTVYYGTDPVEFAPVSPTDHRVVRRQLGWVERPTVVFIGALGDHRKGMDILYSARSKLCHQINWDANLVVVGSGRDLAVWRTRVVADGLADRIRFLGFRTDVPTILAASDLLVHPARYEPYGLGVHEALCRGLPAIVSSACGISERYPPQLQDLILQNPEDVGELIDRLRHWRANLERFAERVRPFSEQLRSRTWTDMARDIRDLILAHS